MGKIGVHPKGGDSYFLKNGWFPWGNQPFGIIMNIRKHRNSYRSFFSRSAVKNPPRAPWPRWRFSGGTSGTRATCPARCG